MVILKADEILARLEQGRREADDPLVISPFPSALRKAKGAAAVDLRLGRWILGLRSARMSHLDVHSQTPTAKLGKMHYVPFGNTYYLHPRSFVLAVTLEWVRVPRDLAGYIVGKSSWGRRGLIIATAAGVHPGFTGCLTLELSNVGEIPIAIQPGMTICQLFLHTVLDTGARQADVSQFVGRRQPSLGHIEPDPTAGRLAEAYVREMEAEPDGEDPTGSRRGMPKDPIRSALPDEKDGRGG